MMTPYVADNGSRHHHFTPKKKHPSAVRPHLDPKHQDKEYNATLEDLYESVLKTLPNPPPKESKNPFTTCWKRSDDAHDDWEDDSISLSPSYTDTSSSSDTHDFTKKRTIRTKTYPIDSCWNSKVCNNADDDEQDDNISLLDPQEMRKVIPQPKQTRGLFRKMKTAPRKKLGGVREWKRLNCLQTCFEEDGDGAFPKFDELNE